MKQPAIEVAAAIAVAEKPDDSEETDVLHSGEVVSHRRILGRLEGGGMGVVHSGPAG